MLACIKPNWEGRAGLLPGASGSPAECCMWDEEKRRQCVNLPPISNTGGGGELKEKQKCT